MTGRTTTSDRSAVHPSGFAFRLSSFAWRAPGFASRARVALIAITALAAAMGCADSDTKLYLQVVVVVWGDPRIREIVPGAPEQLDNYQIRYYPAGLDDRAAEHGVHADVYFDDLFFGYDDDAITPEGP